MINGPGDEGGRVQFTPLCGRESRNMKDVSSECGGCERRMTTDISRIT